MRDPVTAVLDQALQARLLQVHGCLLQAGLALPGTEMLTAELAGLVTLSPWLETPRRRQVEALATALRALATARPRQRQPLLPHGLRLVYRALGPTWRQASLRAVLSGPGALPQGAAHGRALQSFLAELPSHADTPALQSARQELLLHVQSGWHTLADTLASLPLPLSACLANGIAQRLRLLQRLACFLDAEAAHRFSRVESLVLLACCARQDNKTCLHGLLQAMLWRLALGRPAESWMQGLGQALQAMHAAAAGGHCADAITESEQGFVALQRWLAQTASDGLYVQEEALFESVRLAWVFDACAAPLAACLLHLLHELCSSCWYCNVPLPSDLHPGLARMLGELAAQLRDKPGIDADPLWAGKGISMLLLAWPRPSDAKAGHLQMDIRVRDPAGGLLPACKVHELPARLAQALRVIPQHAAQWFSSRHQLQAALPDLERDLLLLEQGAAALRLAPLERYCALLLEVLQLLSGRSTLAFPGELLQQCHISLLHMLDRAAQWLEPAPEAGHMTRLQDWATAATVADAGDDDPWSCLFRELRPAARVLDRSFRLQLQCPPRVAEGPAGPDQLKPVLVILRWLLACSEADARERREAGLPQALAVTVYWSWPGQLQLCDAWTSRIPDARQLRRLCRKAGAISLDCMPLPQGGRCFALRLP